MVSKKITLLLTFFSFIIYGLYSQSDVNFIFRYNNDNQPEFIQRVTWNASEYSVNYKFMLKDQKNKILINVETEDNFLEFSMKAGDYFYKVTAYNILGQAEQETGWEPIKIEQVYLPVIDSISMEIIYLESYQGEPFIIEGKDFTDRIKVELIDRTSTNNQVKTGKIIEKTRERLSVQFDIKNYVEGEYELKLTNPGGIYAYKQFKIKYKKAVDLIAYAGYAPILNSYMGNYNQLMANVFYPVGFTTNFTFFPIKKRFGFIGFGVSFDINYLEDKKNVTLHTLSIKIGNSVDYLHFLNKYLGIYAKFGAGISFSGYLFDYGNENLKKSYTTINPFISTGVQIAVKPYKHIILFSGFDYNQVFFDDSALGFFRPTVSVGFYY